MSEMLIERKGFQSLYAYIEGILYDDGFFMSGGSRNATMTIDYPSKENTQTMEKPIIIVSSEGGDDRAIQLGSYDATQMIFVIDVLGKDKAQRDDIGALIRSNLRNRSLPIYDFSGGFPSTPGDFSGISTVGKMTVLTTRFFNPEPVVHDLFGFGNHQEIRVVVQLPPE